MAREKSTGKERADSPVTDFDKKMERLNSLNQLWKTADLHNSLPTEYQDYFKERFDIFIKSLINEELGRDAELPPYLKITDKHVQVIDLMVHRMDMDKV